MVSKNLKSSYFSTTERLFLRGLAPGGKTVEEILTAFYEARGRIMLSGNLYGTIKSLMKYGFVEKVKERGTGTLYRLTKEGKRATLEDAEQELGDAQKTIDVLRK